MNCSTWLIWLLLNNYEVCMNRLNMEDFYNWHPIVEMAGIMTSTIDGTKLVRLTAKLDFLDETISYIVSVKDINGKTYCWEYDYLNNAIDCYNDESEGCV